ncbi:hypothetical protein GGF32_005742 [Allomyces javanicus]|nr:hypothetical protein GGF32_005742 [Allomyces javanicus]
MTQHQTSIIPADLWDKIRKGGQINVRVKMIGSVGVGKSSLATDLVDVYDAAGNIVEVFPSSGQATGVPSNSKVAIVNPSVLPPNVTMTIQDGDGVAGVGDSNIKITDKNLQDVIDAPAVLLFVAQAGRVLTDLINQLKLLQLVSDIGDRNCFLVLTKTGGASTTTSRRGPPPTSRHYNPTGLLDQLKQAGVGFFEAGRNVACLDFDQDRDDFLQLIRAKLCDLRPVKMRCTYSQLVAAARGDVASLNKMREAMQATVNTKKSDLAWHEKRIKDMGIAILSTVWIPFAGQIASAGMGIARDQSIASVKTLNAEINQLEKEINNKASLVTGLQHRLVEYQKLVAQVVDV